MTISAKIIAEPLRACSKCGVVRPATMFQLYKGRPSGQCRICKTAGEKARRKRDGIGVRSLSRVVDGQKLCLHCETMKPLDQFSPARRGLGGVSAYCRPCFADRVRDPATSRRRTMLYRSRNRPRYLALHRLTQFRRKHQIAITDDGTVTDEFLHGIYATEICTYCEQPTPEKQRTADHMLPLARGGAHSADNICMACNPCNSSKGDRTAEEFIIRRKRNDDHGQDNCGLGLGARDPAHHDSASVS